MALILAIDPDKRQSTQLASLVRALEAELVQRPTASEGLEAIGSRVPDLVLTSPLISPREDARLAAHLRELGAAAAHVQTVTIPMLGAAAPARAKGGMLSALRREKPQTAMTDGCAPEVFADQIRQYLAAAEEQRCTALDAPVMPAVSEAYDDVEAPAELEAFADDESPAESMELEPQASGLAAADDEFGAEEPGLPLAQLLEMVSSWSPREEEPLWSDVEVDVLVEVAAAPPVASEAHAGVPEHVSDEVSLAASEQVSEEVAEEVSEEVAAEVPEELPEELLSLELLQDAGTDHSVVPVVELPADAVSGDALVGLDDLFAAPVEAPLPVAEDFTELYVDPAVVSALEELSRRVPARSLADGILAEAPIPVVEFHSFESLDSIANELAAAPARRAFEPLDDLASLFAATPTYQAPAATGSAAPEPVGNSPFQSLFAETAREILVAPEVQVPGVDPSLFAAPPPVFAATTMAIAASEWLTQPVTEPVAEPATELAIEPAMEAVIAAAMEAVIEPVTEPITEPVVEPVVEVVSLTSIWAEPAAPELVDEPVAVEPAAEWFAAPAALVDDAVAAEPVTNEWFAATEAVAEELTPVTPATPVVEAVAPEPMVEVVEEPTAVADEIWPADPATVVAETPQPFSFTFVDGFGDELRDFEMTPDAAITEAPEESAPSSRDTALPMLDEEALSLIGDAARKASLDALVIEEFERGLGPRRPLRKPKPKRAHAGATQIVPPVAARKKAPVDEWGMFDPEQCGFAALEDDDAVPDARPGRDGSRSRIIPY